MNATRLFSRLAGVLPLALLVLASSAAAQDTEETPVYAIVCLDPANGDVIWRAEPEGLVDPEIYAVDDRILVVSTTTIEPTQEQIDAFEAKEDPTEEDFEALYRQESVGVALAAIDGAVVEEGMEDPSLEGAVGGLQDLPEPWTAANGTVLAVEVGDAIHREDGHVIQRLPAPLQNLVVVGNTVLFTYSKAAPMRSGEVYAYDLERGALAWQFDAWRWDPALEGGETTLAVGFDQVFLGVDQTLFSLAPETGEVLWLIALPAQEVGPWEAYWTRFANVNDKLLVSSFGRLSLLEPSDGSLLWSFDAGSRSYPWPTLADGRLYVATQAPEETVDGLWADEPDNGPVESLVKVTADGLELATIAELPPETVAWSALSETPTADGVPEIVVELHQMPWTENESEIFSVNLSGPVHDNGSAWIKIDDLTETIVLRRDGREVALIHVYEDMGLGFEAPPTWTIVLPFVFFALSLFVLWRQAKATKKSADLFRFPEVEPIYKRSLLNANVATVIPSTGCAIAAGIPCLFLTFIFGSQFLIVTFPVVMLSALLGQFSTTNWIALIGNRKLRAASHKALTKVGVPDDAHFVGIFEPAKKSFFNQMVDTHDDIGFFYPDGDRLVFEGLRYRREISRSQIVGIRHPLVWQFAYLGVRWLALDLRTDEGRVTFCISSREGATLRGSWRSTQELSKVVTAWLRRRP